MFEPLHGGVTAPRGFFTAASEAGIKAGGPDVAVIYSERPATAAALFTANRVQAAPVRWSREQLRRSKHVQAIVVNSGNANACTGPRGLEDAKAMARTAAACLNIPDEGRVLVASTGVIGVPLPMDRVGRGIEAACRALSRGEAADQNAARAIMTTDTVPKTTAVRVQWQSGSVIIGGMAKGAGMIHPNMATMLSFVTTDAAIAPELLQRLLKDTADDSYHMISVDGDTSTNDTVMVLANGCADAPMLCEGTADFEAFREAFRHVHQTLARAIAWDGEGATKRLQVEVTGAASKEDARRLARTVAASNLVKTALFGADANWGRVLAAMGRAGAAFNPDQVHLTFASRAGSVCVLRDSVPQSFDESEARKILEDDVVRIVVELQEGKGQATAWGCDLSYEYVRINGEYRT